MSRKNKPDSKGFVYSTDPSFKFEEINEQVETLSPVQQRLRIRLETKHRAGKAVTLIEGFVGKEQDLEDLGKKLKSFCGTGGSAKDGEIIIQGEQRDKILQWLLKNDYKQSKKFKLTSPFVFWVFVLITFVFLVVEGMCAVYLLIGIKQLIVGHKESDFIKIKSGWMISLLSVIVLIGALFFYLGLVNP